MEIFTVAFFGHRTVSNPFRIEVALEEQIRSLLREKAYVDFLVGRNGEFDQLVASTVRRVRRACRDDNSSLCLVLPYATTEYLNNRESFERYYDSVEISAKSSKVHSKAAIQIRNREMIDRANLVICCIEHENGGAYQTVRYAEAKEKSVIHLAANSNG